MRGNFCLREGRFAEARAAFHQARELDPKLPYVVARLAEVELQQAGGARNTGHRTRYPRAIGAGFTEVLEPASVQQ
jgi:cytochrome c-type biogenesis protein CcmH/NrfG